MFFSSFLKKKCLFWAKLFSNTYPLKLFNENQINQLNMIVEVLKFYPRKKDITRLITTTITQK